MKKPDTKSLNMILAFGMLLLFVGIFFIIGFAGVPQRLVMEVFSFLICLSGLVFLYIYICFSRTPFKLFVGLSLFLNGLFLVIVDRGILPVGIEELWPCMILFISASLFSASRTKGRKFNVSYDFTAISLFVFGIFFLLFSLDVIKHSFRQVMAFLLPVIFILSGIFLIVLFAQRKALLKMIPDETREKFMSGEDFEEDGDDL